MNMDSKLTLTIEKDVIEKAKKYATESGRSLSDLVENYLKLVTKTDERIELSPTVKSLLGAVKNPENRDFKDILSDELANKYLND